MKVLLVLAVTVAMGFAFPQGGINTLVVHDQPLPNGHTTYVQQPGYVQQPVYIQQPANQQTGYVQGPTHYIVQQHQVPQQEPQK